MDYINKENYFDIDERKTKTYKEDNKINSIQIVKDEIKQQSHHNHNDESCSHKYPHNHSQNQKEHDHHFSKDESFKLNEEANLDNFVINGIENVDNFDNNIGKLKHTTKHRFKTFDNSKILISPMTKQSSGVLLNDKRKRIRSKILDANCAHDHSFHEENDSDIEEATLKNVVSSKGKFLSLLQARNICKIFFYKIYYKFGLFYN